MPANTMLRRLRGRHGYRSTRRLRRGARRFATFRCTRMTHLIARQNDAPFALPDERIEVQLVAGGGVRSGHRHRDDRRRRIVCRCVHDPAFARGDRGVAHRRNRRTDSLSRRDLFARRAGVVRRVACAGDDHGWTAMTRSIGNGDASFGMRTGSSSPFRRGGRGVRKGRRFSGSAGGRGTSTDKSVCATLGVGADLARLIRADVAQTLLSVRSGRIERFIASAGIATHETNGSHVDRGVAARAHLARQSAVARAHRSRIVRSRNRSDELPTRSRVPATSATRRRASGSRRTSPPRCSRRSSASWRWSRRGGGFDGRGQPIETRAVTHDAPPNWYRPGYAVRPRARVAQHPRAAVRTHRPECAARHRVAGACSRHDASSTLRRRRRCFPRQLDAAHIAAVSARASRSGIHMQPVRSASR